MHPILFQIGKLYFYTHGVMAVIGIILGAVITYFLAKKKNLNCEYLFDDVVITVLFGIIGARLAYFVIYHGQFQNFAQLIYLWDGGLISYGGFLVGGLTFYLLLAKQKQPILKWLDCLSIGFFFALAIGRIGDLLAGEYAGVITSSTNLRVFSNINVIPVPFYETILCFLISVVAFLVYRKYSGRIIDGMIFIPSVIIYTLGRFFLDFWRDESSLIWIISLGQLVSFILFIIFVAMFVFKLKTRHQRSA